MYVLMENIDIFIKKFLFPYYFSLDFNKFKMLITL